MHIEHWRSLQIKKNIFNEANCKLSNCKLFNTTTMISNNLMSNANNKKQTSANNENLNYKETQLETKTKMKQIK